MITVTLTINGTNYSQYIKYPVSYTNKNLDESLNILELKLFGMTSAVPFKPNTVADITIAQDNVDWLSGKMVITGDIVERIGASDKYIHKLAFVELTYLLTLEVLPDMTITRAEPLCWKDGKNNPDYTSSSSVCTTFGGTYFTGYQPTLLDVVDKILKYSEGTFSKTLTLGMATQNILNAIAAPEMTFTRYTTLEALRLVFAIAKIVPYCLVDGFLNHVGISNTSTSIPNQAFISEAYNGDTYRTRLYSPVENFIGGGDLAGSIVEPINGHLTPRSDKTDITNDTALIKTSRPIYKVERLSLRAHAYYTRAYNTGDFLGTVNYYTVYTPISALPQYWLNPDVVTNEGLNLNDYLYERSAYDLLPNTQNGKGGALFYIQNKPNIDGLTYKPDVVTQWVPPTQPIRKIVQDLAYSNSPQVKPEYISDFISYMSDLWVQEFGAFTPGVTYRYGFMPSGSNFITDDEGTGVSVISRGGGGPMIDNNPSAINIPTLRFNIQYTPYISTKIFTYKERKETDEPQYISTMTYNQSANTISDETLGELHDKVVKRNAAPTKTIKIIEDNLSDIRPLGRLTADKYVVSAADITINAENAVVEYVLSKDYAKLNQYVAVLEKFRQFAIPSEQIVDRQITIERFAKFATSSTSNTSGISMSDYISDDEVNILRLNTDATYKKPNDDTTYNTPTHYLPPTNFAFNNALVFEAQYPTQSLAGFKSEPYEGNTTTRRIEAAEPYVNNLGRFNQFTSLTFVHNTVGTFDLQDSYDLPVFNESSQNTILSLTAIDVDKDARERLTISLIVHHVDTTGKVHINKNFAKQNGLIGGAGFSGQTFYWKYLGTKPYDEGSNATAYNILASQVATLTTVGSSLRFSHAGSATATYQAYALTDANNNILFWVDESGSFNVPANLFLNLSNTY